jgi:hypothetical protein
MEKNKQKQWKSACCIGACPEMSHDGEIIRLRNSNQPEKTLDFTREEWEELRMAFIEKRF